MLLNHALSITKENLESDVDYLYSRMNCPRDISRFDPSEYDISKPCLEIPRMYVDVREEITLSDFSKKLIKKPKWERLFGIKGFFNNIHHLNITAYYFEHIIAPFFFDQFGDGEIWYIDSVETDLEAIWKREYDLANKYFNAEEVLMGSAPQSMSGLFPYAFNDFGLTLPLIINFPLIYGNNIYFWPGNFIFIPIDVFSVFEIYKINIIDFLSGNLDLIYADDSTLSSGIRLDFEFIKRNELLKYLEWYIERLSFLVDFIFQQTDLEEFFLLALTLSRICIETYSIHISSSVFNRKISFFNLLDKYASLINEFISSSCSEAETWKNLVKKSFYNQKLKPILDNIDKSLHSSFLPAGKIIYEDNHSVISFYHRKQFSEDEVADLLRSYRNSHHGYFLRPHSRNLILSHEGNISNLLPDLCIILWHALLNNPKKFFDIFV